MHDRTALAELRIDRFIRERLQANIHRTTAPLQVTAWEAPGEPVSFEEAAAGDFQPFATGHLWGRPWGTTWFRVTGDLPRSWRDDHGSLPANTRAEVVIDLGFTSGQSGFQCEALLWRPEGTPLRGIAPFNNVAVEAVSDSGSIDVFVEAASNPDVGSLFTFEPTDVGDPETAGTDPLYRLRQVDVALRDLEVSALLADTVALRGLVAELDTGSPRRAEVLVALERMIDAVDPHDVAGTASAGRAVLAPLLARGAHDSAHTLHAIGHAHIDSAWLWPVRETARKVSRTFSNVLSLMDEDPDFVFASSSAQQFAWIKQHYPDLWERVKARVAEGRFIPVGGMWVESDTNMPGGEALARQFVQGKGFFQREFGIDTPEVWLPDSFGYTGSLPQIAKAAGARWFLTQKISWNETNRMPHHTFLWEGIDGTRLFTHFPPVDKYNSDVSSADLAHAERNYSDKGRGTVSLLPYGYGDGGGGPTREMTAMVARTESLEGSPRVVHSTPRAFFEAAENEYPLPEVWAGELYLEFHRGTYTSQLATKQGNRRCEHLLREAELWATTASVRTGAAYPADRLAELWQTVLLQQFHDILPGSSIAWVHKDAERNYAHVAAELEKIIGDSLRALAGTGSRRLEANAAPHTRDGIPALGASAATPAARVTPLAHDDGYVLENTRVRVVIDGRGVLSSIRDLRADREVVAPGRVAGLLQLHRDTPTQWDAWDIDTHYRHHVEDLLGADALELDGDAVVVTRSFGDSRIVSRISLAADSSVVDFDFDIDWHERQKLLKLAFPVDLHTDSAASEIQFGHIERPTHTNTSWDAARFETVAHRWVRVAEPDFGVAVVNDSTYGHDITRDARDGGGTITDVRLSLVRGALFPDPGQDQGRHVLHVGLVVGADVSDAVVEGYRANLPVRSVTDSAVDEIAPLVSVADAGVVIEAVKLAEDGSGDVVVRLYEALGRRARTTLSWGFAQSGTHETDLLERPLPADALTAESEAVVELSLRPFQLVTLRVSPAR
ncbi:glycoside hydrolase family 38 C-terminal domain-containing protein [Microbacterium sp. SSW1-59]|uniref:alpha-mannosidase n=1 Tax=Microbacterium xanthum TaxID=3079794 RepID=UPI002AD368D5|nr:glycoside hydrolase family 38 C-terminal domain-containing protein [Microbacterium sp. SSW1-59]MDZ8201397.1 glycoside hydrolase family 38 C-terminal domain-containing protein [Microbacterium sp. SSW1-59]